MNVSVSVCAIRGGALDIDIWNIGSDTDQIIVV